MEEDHRVFHALKHIPPGVWAIGLAHMLINSSSIVIYCLTPIYLTEILGVTVAGLGLIEGLMEFLAWCSRLISGVISDRIRKRKLFLIVAYTLAVISKPFFVLASNVYWFVFARSVDRLGNGLQASPREALIADLAPKKYKGASFGLRYSLSVTGSMAGALMLILFIETVGINYTFAFSAITVPPIIALLFIIFFTRDRNQQPASQIEKISVVANIKHLVYHYPKFWIILLLAAVYTLSNYSGAFMILHAKTFYDKASVAPLVMVCQNMMGIFAAYPIASMSDKGERLNYLYIGFILAILANTIMAYSGSIQWILLGTAIWGAQMVICQSIITAAIADQVDFEVRGTAFGIFYITIAAVLLICNTMIGNIFEKLGPAAAFNTSSVILLASIILLTFINRLRKRWT